MSAGGGSAHDEEFRASRLRYRIACFLASVVVLGLIVTPTAGGRFSPACDVRRLTGL